MKLDQLLMKQKTSLKDSAFPALFAGDEITISYLPEIGASGINFINKLRKKNIFNEVLIYPYYTLGAKKIISKDYIADFKKLNPNIKTVYKFKTFMKNRANVIDLTPLMDLFSILINQQPKFKVLNETIDAINNYFTENVSSQDPTGEKHFIFVDCNSKSNFNFLDSIYRLFRKKAFKLNHDLLKIKGLFVIALNESEEFDIYPLIHKKEKHLIFRPDIYRLIKKDLTGIEEEEINEFVDSYEKINEARNNILNITDKLLNKIGKGSAKDSKETADFLNQLGNAKERFENYIDLIYQELSSNDIPGNDYIEKLHRLFPKDTTDPKKIQKIEKLISYIDDLNKIYNGSIKIKKDLINKSADIYYDPMEIVKLDEISVYNKQKTEFDEVLDKSMFDLIKSIERDKDAGIEVLDIKVEVQDTNKSRFKKYKVKLKNTKFGKKTPYEIEFLTPYPIKGKYLKIGGVRYIMLNQFMAKPILKIKPNIVRLYTHFSTFSVTLKTHKYNNTQDFHEILMKVTSSIKGSKIDYVESTNNDPREKYKFYIDRTFIDKTIEL